MKQLDIKEVKKILYQLEDITELGTKLPVLAFQKLKEFYPNLDTQDLCMDIYKREVDDFIKRYEQDFIEKDERALLRAFIRMKKKHPDRLEAYRNFYDGLNKVWNELDSTTR